jgi:hypothetical protein
MLNVDVICDHPPDCGIHLKPDGLSWLTSTFRLCAPLTSTAELKAWLAEAWGDVAMVNYPYAAGECHGQADHAKK